MKPQKLNIATLSTAAWVLILALILAGCGGAGGGASQPAGAQNAAATSPVTNLVTEAPPTAPHATTAPTLVAPLPEGPVVPAVEGTPVEIEVGKGPTGEVPRISRDPVEVGEVPVMREPFQTWCMFAGTGATMGIDGERLNFTCSQVGDVTVGLFGDIQPGLNGWMIARKSFKPAADGFDGLLSEMAAIEGVLLHDGMRCYWAGEGATLALDGKRANFTCDPANGAEYVLIGDVTLGDEGWMIERAVVVHSATGTALEKAAPVLIDALGVRK